MALNQNTSYYGPDVEISPMLLGPRLVSSVVSVSDSWPGGCEFDSQLRQLVFPLYFCHSPLQKHVRKVVGGFGKKICINTGVRKPGNTYASHKTLAVKVALNPNTINQPMLFGLGFHIQIKKKIFKNLLVPNKQNYHFYIWHVASSSGTLPKWFKLWPWCEK